jgi:hypothetical protein
MVLAARATNCSIAASGTPWANALRTAAWTAPSRIAPMAIPADYFDEAAANRLLIQR